MKILVTGGTGQLGTDVTRLLTEKGYEVHSYAREQLDIVNQEQVKQTVEYIQPDVIIHTAAYTKVDLAEQEVKHAYQVNALGARNLAVEAEKYQAKLIHISTDYVFDGQASVPYTEFSEINPQSVYGKSKWAGEQFVRQLCSRFFIVRTSWVYGKYGHNFVKTMLRLAETRNEINVVHDQVGCPTYTVDLAKFLMRLLETEAYGTYHASNTGSCSWYEFACAIFAAAGLTNMKVNPIPTSEYPLPAPRPAYSVLDHMMIRLQGMEDLRPWQEALQEFMREFARPE
ncbi:dTDP-4-dehydrorhamnose reductase [Aneurinibacillus danicus]|uniref:dTDP-4-dehydrorhamnose reductase n=1 Tax=Aneurinibacillus danicus TaxID=267746 RepID=A0A511V8F7_9BACL|nr:dTDP-4-dehydrorhamnose reductase [Aneurinibacillus danicus]GEN35160.1 NAD(P)-dependent oxidoreductase [Aneurinibacillus danicus]